MSSSIQINEISSTTSEELKIVPEEKEQRGSSRGIMWLKIFNLNPIQEQTVSSTSETCKKEA